MDTSEFVSVSFLLETGVVQLATNVESALQFGTLRMGRTQPELERLGWHSLKRTNR